MLYDIEVEVPRRAAVELSTVLEGDVELAGTDGAFLVRNVNGDGGRARRRRRRQRHSPSTASSPCASAATPTGLATSATSTATSTSPSSPASPPRCASSTLNGEGWSDFPYTLVPLRPEVSESRRDGRYVIKSDWSQGIRIGAGGPQLSFGTVNGDVLIRKST